MYTDFLCNQKKIPRMHYEVWLGMHRFLEPQLHCLVSINTLHSFLMWHPQSVSDFVGETFLHVSTCSDFWLTLFSRPTDFCWKVLESSCIQLLYAAMHFANVDLLSFLWICRVSYCIFTREKYSAAATVCIKTWRGMTRIHHGTVHQSHKHTTEEWQVLGASPSRCLRSF